MNLVYHVKFVGLHLLMVVLTFGMYARLEISQFEQNQSVQGSVGEF